jgi:hypothetical protein
MGKRQRRERSVDRNPAGILVSGAAGTSPRPAARPPGGGANGAPVPSAAIPAPKAAAGCRERAGAPGFSCCRTRRRESHPPDVCATSKEAEARAGCIYPQGLWPGRCPLSESPGPLHPRKHAVAGRLKGEIPLSTSMYTQKYTPWVYIFEHLLNSLPRRGRQPGARGRAARPPARPHSNPLHTPNSLKQITGCATES